MILNIPHLQYEGSRSLAFFETLYAPLIASSVSWPGCFPGTFGVGSQGLGTFISVVGAL